MIVPKQTSRPLTVAIAGGGARGRAYAEAVAALPDLGRVVALAEPREYRRRELAGEFGIDASGLFADWRELAARPRLADIVIIALLDDLHHDAAVAFADLGYDILLEKPIAPTEEECVAIAERVAAAGVDMAVSHVLRYTPYTTMLESILSAGHIGEVVNIQHLEPIGHTHFAHSYVRGNWRREDESGPLLLSKACHDVDWLAAIIKRPAKRVASFGSLTHFRRENQPADAADRCLDCSLQAICPYAATRLYRQGLTEPDTPLGYFTTVMAGELTSEAVEEALANGPYGRCVYACDNEVVDHQVVQIEYEGGITADFTMTALSKGSNRITRIFGTKGQITGDGRHIEVFDFLTEETRTYDSDAGGYSAADGHAGGDAGIVKAWLEYCAGDRTEEMPSGITNSVASHRVVFAAERARRTGTVVTL
jgi:predicted dehydrogenase